MVTAITHQVTTLNSFPGEVCILHAADDKVVNFEYLQKLKLNRLWKNTVQVVPDCGHGFFIDNHVGLANILIEFFKR